MRLSDVLKALSKNINTNISILDANNDIVIIFNASGFQGVENDVTSANVKYITVKNNNLIEVSTDYTDEITP